MIRIEIYIWIVFGGNIWISFHEDLEEEKNFWKSMYVDKRKEIREKNI